MSGPSYEIGLLQVTSHRALQFQVAHVLEKFSLNTTHWFMLGKIADCHQITASDLAKALHVDAPLITMMANMLIRKGLAERIKHPKDGRAKLLILTAKGAQTVIEVERLLDKTLRDLLDGLGAPELYTYKKVLETIIVNYSRLDAERKIEAKKTALLQNIS